MVRRAHVEVVGVGLLFPDLAPGFDPQRSGYHAAARPVVTPAWWPLDTMRRTPSPIITVCCATRAGPALTLEPKGPRSHLNLLYFNTPSWQRDVNIVVIFFQG